MADKGALLEKARKEREQRLRFRTETRAATRIQALVRAAAAVRCPFLSLTFLPQLGCCLSQKKVILGWVVTGELMPGWASGGIDPPRP